MQFVSIRGILTLIYFQVNRKGNSLIYAIYFKFHFQLFFCYCIFTPNYFQYIPIYSLLLPLIIRKKSGVLA